MKNFNIMRPIMILLVAFFTYNVALLIGHSFGLDEEVAENIAFAAMVLGAVFAFMRLNKKKKQ